MSVQVIALTLLQGKLCSTREEMLSCEWHVQEGHADGGVGTGTVKTQQGRVIIPPGFTAGAAASVVLS